MFVHFLWKQKTIQGINKTKSDAVYTRKCVVGRFIFLPSSIFKQHDGDDVANQRWIRQFLLVIAFYGRVLFEELRSSHQLCISSVGRGKCQHSTNTQHPLTRMYRETESTSLACCWRQSVASTKYFFFSPSLRSSRFHSRFSYSHFLSPLAVLVCARLSTETKLNKRIHCRCLPFGMLLFLYLTRAYSLCFHFTRDFLPCYEQLIVVCVFVFFLFPLCCCVFAPNRSDSRESRKSSSSFAPESDISAQQPLLSLLFASPLLLDGAIFMMIILLVLPSLSTFFFLYFFSFALSRVSFYCHIFRLSPVSISFCTAFLSNLYCTMQTRYTVSETTIKDTGKSVVVVGCLR